MDKNAQTERLATLFNIVWTEERFNLNDGNQDSPNQHELNKERFQCPQLRPKTERKSISRTGERVSPWSSVTAGLWMRMPGKIRWCFWPRTDTARLHMIGGAMGGQEIGRAS